MMNGKIQHQARESLVASCHKSVQISSCAAAVSGNLKGNTLPPPPTYAPL